MICDRVWQAEAIEDGRLTSTDALSFQRHVAGCRSCRAQVAALARLRAAVALLPEPTRSPLEHRRQRYELLRRANDWTTRPPRRSSTWPLMAASAVAAIIAALVVYPRAPIPPVPGAVAEPRFQIVAAPGAAWRVLQAGPSLRVLAQRGPIELAVSPLSAGQRFTLALPDGEIDVHGTRLAIEIEAEHTREVRVHDGRVVVRLRGSAPILLGAGERWTRAPRTISVPLEAAPVAPAPPRKSRPAKLVERSKTPEADSGKASDPASANEPPRSAGREFGVAMTAFSAGEYERAAALFRSFAELHPTDSRAEDALFLQSVALARRGEIPASRLTAREYLNRYPGGLRRREAEQLAR